MKIATHRIALAFVAVATLALTGLVVSPAQAAPAATVLSGTWLGTSEGYFDGGYTSGREKIVITKVKRHSAKGAWQYRSSSADRWSAPEPATFAVRAEGDGTWEVYGSDAEGVYVGALDPSTGVLKLTYMAAGPQGGTLFFTMTKKK